MAQIEHTEHTELTEHDHFNEAGASHVLDWKIYGVVFCILVVLMLATIGAAQYDLGWANNFIAMGIAVFKATLVVAFFMQVKYSTRLTKLWAAIGFIWLLFLFGTLGDYLTRNWIFIRGWTPLH